VQYDKYKDELGCKFTPTDHADIADVIARKDDTVGDRADDLRWDMQSLIDAAVGTIRYGDNYDVAANLPPDEHPDRDSVPYMYDSSFTRAQRRIIDNDAANVRRVEQEEVEAETYVDLKKNSFVMFLDTPDLEITDDDLATHYEGISRMEYNMPIGMGKVLSDFTGNTSDDRNREVHIRRWRQPVADPNKAWIAGVRSNNNTEWRDKIVRSSIFYVDPTMTNQGGANRTTLTKAALKEIGERENVPYIYTATDPERPKTKVLVYQQP
jgi:hypothetical protein